VIGARNIFAVLVGFTTAAFALSMIPDGFVKAINPQAAWVSVPGIFTVRVGVYMDPLSIFMACIAAGIGALILLYSIGYMSGEED